MTNLSISAIDKIYSLCEDYLGRFIEMLIRVQIQNNTKREKKEGTT